MTLAEITRSPTRPARSVADVVANLDVLKLARMSLWVVFCILLIASRLY